MYCLLLRNQYELYAALEPALERHALHPMIAPIHFPGLERLARLESDLETLAGREWRSTLRVLPATGEYAARLRALADSSPELLVAHAYVRYLGDLSGGQMLKQIVAKHLGLPIDEGTRFYEFAELGDLKAFGIAFRKALDALPFDEPRASRLVIEAQWAFEQHVKIFEEMDPEALTS